VSILLLTRDAHPLAGVYADHSISASDSKKFRPGYRLLGKLDEFRT
jgi:hypothetical protein